MSSPQLILLTYQSFDARCFLLSWGERIVKGWWGMVFTPEKWIDFWILDEKNYFQKLLLPLDISPISSWLVLILTLTND